MAFTHWHALAALPASLLALGRDGMPAAAALMGSAVLIDADHLVDWALNGGRLDWSRRVIVPLHGWEVPAALLAAGRLRVVPAWLRHLAAALGAGCACHLLLDQLTNRPGHPLGYFTLHRLRVGFRREASGWARSRVLSGPAPKKLNFETPAQWELVVSAVFACLLMLGGERRR